MDEVYIQRILDGNPEAFRHLISKYKDMAYSLAMSVLKDEFYAEEAVQISFVKAFENLSTFKRLSKFSTWFYRITINESFKLAKKKTGGYVDFVETPPDSHDQINNSFLKLEEDDQIHIINEALKRLSPKESLCLRLFYLEENSLAEICDITGWSQSSVKVILHRARLNLKIVISEIYKIDKGGLY